MEDLLAQMIYSMGLVGQADIEKAMAMSSRLFLGLFFGVMGTAECMFTYFEAPLTHFKYRVTKRHAVFERAHHYINYHVYDHSMICVPRNYVLLLHLSLLQIVVISTTWQTRNISVLS